MVSPAGIVALAFSAGEHGIPLGILPETERFHNESGKKSVTVPGVCQGVVVAGGKGATVSDLPGVTRGSDETHIPFFTACDVSTNLLSDLPENVHRFLTSLFRVIPSPTGKGAVSAGGR